MQNKLHHPFPGSVAASPSEAETAVTNTSIRLAGESLGQSGQQKTTAPGLNAPGSKAPGLNAPGSNSLTSNAANELLNLTDEGVTLNQKTDRSPTPSVFRRPTGEMVCKQLKQLGDNCVHLLGETHDLFNFTIGKEQNEYKSIYNIASGSPKQEHVQPAVKTMTSHLGKEQKENKSIYNIASGSAKQQHVQPDNIASGSAKQQHVQPAVKTMTSHLGKEVCIVDYDALRIGSGREKSMSGSPREENNNDNGAEEETQAAWANEELERTMVDEDAWSARGIGLLTPKHQTAQGVLLENTGDAKVTHTDNSSDTHSPLKENGLGSDALSSENKLHSDSKSDKITPTTKLHGTKLLYLSTETATEEPRILSNTSLISRNINTFYHGLAPASRHWEGSRGSLSRYNTTLSFQDDGKHSHKVQNCSKHWEGNKSVDGHVHMSINRQPTIILNTSNTQANQDKQCDFLVTSYPVPGFLRSKTVGFSPSKGFPAKDVDTKTKRDDPSKPQLSPRITPASNMHPSKKVSRGNMQTENEAPKNFNAQEWRTSINQDQAGAKLQYNIPKAVMPKTGLIKLTSLKDEKKNPALYDDYLKKKEGQPKHNLTTGTKNIKITGNAAAKLELIGRMVKLGPFSERKLMTKQEEKPEEEWKDIQGFTFGDLQKGALNYITYKKIPVPRKKSCQEHEQTPLVPPLELITARDNDLPVTHQ